MFALVARAGEGFGKEGFELGEKTMKFGSGAGHFGSNNSFAVLFPLLHLITWVLFAVLLVALIRWIWAKGDKK